MFRSYTYISTSNQKEKAVYEIIDSDFGKTVTLGNGYIVGVGVATAIVAEYGKRNLDIGKNIALLCLYLEEYYSLKKIIQDQDCLCPQYISNWHEIALKRNHYLDKMWAMR